MSDYKLSNPNASIFKRTLFANKFYHLEFFMYEPRMEYNTKYRTYQVTYNPILQLGWINHESDTWYGRECIFNITPKTLYQVIEFFNTVIGWFYDKSMPDFFGYNEEGRLVFNSKYNDVKAIINTGENTGRSNILKAIPISIQDDNNEKEGIFLFINEDRFRLSLTVDQLKSLMSLLTNFSFYNEVQLAIEVLRYTTEKNQLIVDGKDPNFKANIYKTPFDV